MVVRAVELAAEAAVKPAEARAREKAPVERAVKLAAERMVLMVVDLAAEGRSDRRFRSCKTCRPGRADTGSRE